MCNLHLQRLPSQNDASCYRRKNGKQQALFYQYGGQSSSGLSPNSEKNWRCIPIERIENLVINDDSFQTAHNHSRAQTCVNIIDVEIGF